MKFLKLILILVVVLAVSAAPIKNRRPKPRSRPRVIHHHNNVTNNYGDKESIVPAVQVQPAVQLQPPVQVQPAIHLVDPNVYNVQVQQPVARIQTVQFGF